MARIGGNDKRDITEAMLNEHYGDRGRSFKIEEEALAFHRATKGSYICRLVDYNPMDIQDVSTINHRIGSYRRSGTTLRDGARAKTVGYLVYGWPVEPQDNKVVVLKPGSSGSANRIASVRPDLR